MRVSPVACAVSVAAMSVVSGAAWPESRLCPQGEAVVPERAARCDGGLMQGAGARLAIEVRWLHRVPGARERGLFERAARAWSRRLRAYTVADRPRLVGPVTLRQAGYYLRDGHRVLHTRYVEIDADTRVDDVEGLLILVDDEWWEPVSTGQPHGWEIDPETGAFHAWLAVVRLFHRARGDLGTMVHEIGHVLGLGTAPGYHALVREDPGGDVFTGRYAVAAYGGPVPLEHAHTAPCPSVMSYRSCAGEAPSELDFAMLKDLGYEVVDGPAGPCLDARPGWAARRYR